MELASRKGQDRFVQPGAYRDLEATLRQRGDDLSRRPAVIFSAFDRSTRLLPFILYDKMMFPAGARTIAGALHQAGFQRTRAVFQLWNPNFRPSKARIDGKPLEMLLVSSMQIHVRRAYEAIADAWSMGADRPLIIAGGPKAIYEPYHFWPMQTPQGPIGPDLVVTGEAYVLLDMLNVVSRYLGRGDTLRTAFDRARCDGAMNDIPGLVFLAPEATWEEPSLIDTGLQRLVQHLDELPHEATGLSLLEPPHRGEGLSTASLPDRRVKRHAHICSLLVTQGCKFSCPYCPIPAFNQKSWRYRSPDGLAHEIRSVRERYGIKYFFGTDDNFFNRRETAAELLETLASTRFEGRPLGSKIRFSTEATQFDTFKNRDLLPLGRQAGLYAIWFGIEDLTASLVNKGQKPEVTMELFRLLDANKISPMAMMMYHEGQPFHSGESLYGLFNQVDFLRRVGAVSMQCTVHTPAVGTREFEKTYEGGQVLKTVGGYRIPEAKIDGNHVIVDGDESAWRRQLKLIGGYASFYNPLNLWRAFRKDGRTLRSRRLGYQLAGNIATVRTALQMLPYTFRLLTGNPTYHTAAPAQSVVPVRSPEESVPREPLAA